jgi:hypothetical protein
MATLSLTPLIKSIDHSSALSVPEFTRVIEAADRIEILKDQELKIHNLSDSEYIPIRNRLAACVKNHNDQKKIYQCMEELRETITEVFSRYAMVVHKKCTRLSFKDPGTKMTPTPGIGVLSVSCLPESRSIILKANKRKQNDKTTVCIEFEKCFVRTNTDLFFSKMLETGRLIYSLKEGDRITFNVNLRILVSNFFEKDAKEGDSHNTENKNRLDKMDRLAFAVIVEAKEIFPKNKISFDGRFIALVGKKIYQHEQSDLESIDSSETEDVTFYGGPFTIAIEPSRQLQSASENQNESESESKSDKNSNQS